MINTHTMKKLKITEGRVTSLDLYDLDDEIQSGEKTVDDVEIFKQADSASDEEKKRAARLADIAFARRTGKYDEVFGEIVKTMKENLPDVSPVANLFSCENTEESYFITDEETVVLHLDITNENIAGVVAVCETGVIFDELIGNIELSNLFGKNDVKLFPVGFPKKVDGSVVVRNIPRPIDYENAPGVVTGDVEIKMINKFNQLQANKYIKRLSGDANESKSENQDMKSELLIEAKKRFNLGEKYISSLNEEMGTKLSALIPARHGQELSGNAKIVKNINKRILFDVIDPIITIPWGNINDSDVDVIDNPFEIARDLSVRGKFKGIKIFTTKNGLISMVYAYTPSAKYPTLVYLKDDSRNLTSVSDSNTIYNTIKDRNDYYERMFGSFKEFGMTPNEVTKDEDTTVAKWVYSCAYWWLCNHLTKSASDYSRRYISSVFDLNRASEDETFDRVMDILFGRGSWTLNEDPKKEKFVCELNYNFKGYAGDDRKTVFFKDINSNDISTCRNNFVLAAEKHNPLNEKLINSLSEKFLKCIAFGCGIRLKDTCPTYTVDDIEQGSKDELVDIIKSIMDVKLSGTSAKRGSYEPSNLSSDKAAPATVCLLFPDKMAKEYKINVNVKEENIKRMQTVASRALSKIGLQGEIGDFSENIGKVFGAIKQVKENLENDNLRQDAYAVIKGAFEKNKASAAGVDLDQVRKVFLFIPTLIDGVLGFYTKHGADEIESNDVAYNNVSEFVSNLFNVVDKMTVIRDGSLSDKEIVINFKDIAKTLDDLIQKYNNIADELGETPLKGKVYDYIVDLNTNLKTREEEQKKLSDVIDQSEVRPSGVDVDSFTSDVTKVTGYASSLRIAIGTIRKNLGLISDNSLKRTISRNIDTIVADIRDVAKFGNTIVNSGDFEYLADHKDVLEAFKHIAGSELMKKTDVDVLGTKEKIEAKARIIKTILPDIETILDAADTYDAYKSRSSATGASAFAESLQQRGYRLVESASGIRIFKRI